MATATAPAEPAAPARNEHPLLLLAARRLGIGVSHDLAVVGGLVSDVAVMYSRRIIEIGTTARVFGTRCTRTPEGCCLPCPRRCGPRG